MSLREAAIVWSYPAGDAEIEAKGLWISLDKNSPCASKTRVLCVGPGPQVSGASSPPPPSSARPPCCRPCQGHSLLQEITSDTGRQRVAQICSCSPVGTGCSSHSSFRDDSATAQTARHPLCGPQELCLQLPNAPSAGCLPQPSGGWQRPSALPTRVPVANFLVHFVTSELGPACACPQSLFTPSQGREWLVHAIGGQNCSIKFGFSLHGTSAPLEWGSSGAPEWGAGTGNTLRPGVA